MRRFMVRASAVVTGGLEIEPSKQAKNLVGYPVAARTVDAGRGETALTPKGGASLEHALGWASGLPSTLALKFGADP
jgi:hypothetical protein